VEGTLIVLVVVVVVGRRGDSGAAMGWKAMQISEAPMTVYVIWICIIRAVVACWEGSPGGCWRERRRLTMRRIARPMVGRRRSAKKIARKGVRVLSEWRVVRKSG
jgi:hypothetical protein